MRYCTFFLTTYSFPYTVPWSSYFFWKYHFIITHASNCFGANSHFRRLMLFPCIKFIDINGRNHLDSYALDVSAGVLNTVVHLVDSLLTRWGRVTHICVSKLTIIRSDNGWSPGRRQAIIWTNAGILLIRTVGTNFSEILSEIHALSFKKMHLKMSSAK